MVSQEKQAQVIETLKQQPAAVQQIPQPSFTDHHEAQEVSFEAHLAGKIPVARYVPLYFDLGTDTVPDDSSSPEAIQDYFNRFMMVH